MSAADRCAGGETGYAMKVVVNALSARLGGGQTYLRNLLSHIPDTPNLEIIIFAPDDLVPQADRRIRCLQAGWPTENPYFRSIWERLLLPAFLRREGADVLFCPGGVVGTPVPKNCKIVTMFRNMIPFDERVRQSVPWGLQRLRNWILYRLMLGSMARADLTIFISDYARRVIESLVQIPHPITIPHGVGEAFRTHNQKPPRPAALPEGEYLLYVSRFDVYKHHYEVVTAYASLPLPLQERFALVLVGEADSPEAVRVQALIARLGLKGRVHMVGGIPYRELPAFYRHAKLMLFASSCENCPNILLEALGSGRPVLSSNVMPMPEFGGDAVQYFSPFDPDDIRRAIENVLSDDAYARRLAAAAAERSLCYDWQRTAEMTWCSILGLAEDAQVK